MGLESFEELLEKCRWRNGKKRKNEEAEVYT